MNAEKILKWSVAASGHLKQGANEKAAEILDYLKTEAEAEIRHAAARQSGNGNRQKAAERILKSAYKMPQERIHGSWSDENGAQYICDTFRLIKLFVPLPLPTISEKENSIDAVRLIDSVKHNAVPLSLPDIVELRSYIKINKEQKKAIKDKSACIYDFGDGLPQVNAQFLLDVLELLPDSFAFISSRNAITGSIYFESIHGCGILCPVRKDV